MRNEWWFKFASTLVGLGLWLGISAGSVPAGELPRRGIMEDATWLLHIDMDALKPTDFYQNLVAQGQAKKLFNLAIQSAGQEFKMDFTRCGSMTFFGGMEDDEDAWAGILKMSADYRQELLGSLDKLAAKDNVPLDKIETHPEWHGFDYDGEVYIYSPAVDTVVLGEEDSAEHATELAAGKKKAKSSPLARDWDKHPGAFLSVAAMNTGEGEFEIPEGLEFNPTALKTLMEANPLLAKPLESADWGAIEKGSLLLGEITNQFWLSLDLKTTNATSAVQLHQVLTNVAAFAPALAGTNRTWQSLARQLQITTARDTIHISLKHPTQVDGQSIYKDWISLPGKGPLSGTETNAAGPVPESHLPKQ